MRNLLLLLALNITGSIYSQQYVPLPLQNCFWQMTDYGNCYNVSANPQSSSSSLTYKLYPSGNIVIKQKSYVQFFRLVTNNSSASGCSLASSTSNGYYCAIRQDTANRMVYIVYNNDTIEKTLYNFNYITGDSVKTVLSVILNSPIGNTARVIDSVFYRSYNDGICRKTFRLKPIAIGGGIFHNYIIEGIGNDVGLLNNYSSIFYGQPPVFTHYETRTSFLSINNFTISTTTANTCYNTVSLSEQNVKQNINLFPNPTTNILNIGSDLFATSISSIQLFDLTGREILKEILNQPSNKIDFSGLSNGIYFAKIIVNNEPSNYKIIKQ